MNALLNQSCRVAFAALLHDLGKFAQRADIELSQNRLETHKGLYCPSHLTESKAQYWTHYHAAYTALAFDLIEQNMPDLIKGDMSPFASRTKGEDITDSLVNAAAMHHRPDTFLQWVIATADRVASGFEREKFEAYNRAEDKTETGKNHFQARLLTLFEQIEKQDISAGSLHYRYPLTPLTPANLFPQTSKKCEPSEDAAAKAQYKTLWNDFLTASEATPCTHRHNWSLWLDHFDSAWQTYTHAIPAATAFNVKPDVSLYDHSKTTAALAVALWRWHLDQQTDNDLGRVAMRERGEDWEAQKFLLIQGDFFGIQDFIFAEGSQTNQSAAKILRGRSFYVSLLTEVAALKILDALDLPPTSQITNAAGKFLIVAPNTDDVINKMKAVRKELDDWFIQQSFGVAGMGLVWLAASCNDFVAKPAVGRVSTRQVGLKPDLPPEKGFAALIKKLFDELAEIKLQRFDLCNSPILRMETDYQNGVCAWQGRLPADDITDGNPSCALSRDQIKIGQTIAKKDRLLIFRAELRINQNADTTPCELAIFGYRIAFTATEAETGKFGELARTGGLVRCWDFSYATTMDASLWNGYARRYINGYVPTFTEKDISTRDKYAGLSEEDETVFKIDNLKTLNHLACEDRRPTENGKWQGQVALMVLKGDVDNLGNIFQRGLTQPTFAKMAALSRQMNAFFAIYLPTLCATEYPNVYTVFAGGDDFFMIGSWYQTQQLAARMATEFKRYVAENAEIHFSAGMTMTKAGQPIYGLAEGAETALGVAKGAGKNAVQLFGQTVPWAEWVKVKNAETRLDELRRDYNLSTGFVYSMLQLVDLSEQKDKPEAAMWRSKLAYRTARLVAEKHKGADNRDKRQRAQTEIVQALGEQGIAALKGKYRIPLFNHFYRQRK